MVMRGDVAGGGMGGCWGVEVGEVVVGEVIVGEDGEEHFGSVDGREAGYGGVEGGVKFLIIVCQFDSFSFPPLHNIW